MFGGTAYFNQDTLVSNGEFDVYIAIYNFTGELIWIEGFGSAEIDQPNSIVGDNNSIYVSCWFQGEALIGDTLLLDHTSHILQLSNSGILQDIIQIGNYHRNTCTIDTHKDIYATGSFHNTTIFGDTSLTSTNMGANIFVCKIIYENSSNINYYTFESNFKIYPNPAHVEIYCRLQNANCKSELLIYDMFGRQQEKIKIPAGQNQLKINVSDYPAGIYIAVLKNEQRILGRRTFVVR